MAEHTGEVSPNRHHRRHRTLFLSIAVTFLVICVLLAVFFLISLELSTRTFREEQNRIGHTTAEVATRQVRNQINEYIHLCDLISADGKMEELPERLKEEQTVWIKDALALRSTLLSVQANFMDTALQDVLVFYPAEKVIVSSLMIFTEYNLSFFTGQHQADMTFLETLPEEKNALGRTEDGLCWIIRGVYHQGRIFAYILLGFQPESIFTRYYDPEDQMQLTVNGQTIFLSQQTADPETLDLNTLIPDESGLVMVKGRRYYQAKEKISSVDLSISGLISAETELQAIRSFHLRGLLQLLVSLLFMIALGLVFTYRIFLPIRRLLANAMIMEEASSVSRAMETVSGRLQSLSAEKKLYQESLQASDYLVQGDRLRHLLKLPKEQAEEAYQAFLEDHHLGSRKWVTETPIQYDPSAQTDSELPPDLTQDQNWFYSLSYMLFSNTLNARINFILIKYADAYVLITDGEEKGDMALVQHAVAEYTRYLEEYHINGVICAATIAVNSAEQMKTLMDNIPMTMENLRFYQGQDAVNASSASSRKLFPSLQQLNTLTRLLEAGNTQEAYQLLNRLCDSLFEQNADWRYCVRRVHGLLIVVMTALQKQNPSISQNSFSEYEERITSAPTVEYLRKEVDEILRELLLPLESVPEETPSVFEEFRQFLEEHYMDHDLNLSVLAAQFSLNESTVSRIFRQEVNMTFLEYVQALRVQKAKELLATESVKDTAQKTGFWDTQALIRVFKKYEGITPGQYKELLGKNANQ